MNKKPLAVALMLFSLCLMICLPVLTAQEEGDSIETLITLDYREANLKDVIDYIARRSRKTILLDADVDEKVTIALVAIPWREALNAVAERAKVVVSKNGNIYNVSKPPRITMNFRDADIRVVIEIIAKLSNANIIVASDVEGSVNVHLKDIPWNEALSSVIKTANYAMVKEPNGILRIVSRGSLETQMESRYFKLKYIAQPDRYMPKITTEYSDSAAADLAASTDPEKFSLLTVLRGLSSTSGKVNFEPKGNIIIATDTGPILDEMKKLIDEYDIAPRQVYVVVRFVRTQVEDQFDYGVNWSNGIRIDNSLGSVVTRLPFNLGQGGFEDNLAVGKEGPSDSAIAGLVSTPYTFGTMSFLNTQTTLRLLKNKKSTEIIQAPKLLALDGEEATIFVGEEVRYAESSVTIDQFGNPIVNFEEASASPVSVGFQLLVKPRVIPETNQVMLLVIPEFKTLTGTGDVIPGFDHFESGSQTLELPRVSSETVVTKMLLEDGQTGVIGGLLNTSQTHTDNRIPFLGSLPVLGRLFRYNGRTFNSRHLMIFVTPHIMRTQEETQKMTREIERKRQEQFIQDQIERVEKMEIDDEDFDNVENVPAGNGIYTPEEIAELRRKFGFDD